MIHKKFNFSYAELEQRCDRLLVSFERDATQFASLGYGDEFKTSLDEKIVYYKGLFSDEYWRGQWMLKTEEKNNALSALVNLLSEIRFRAKLALGEKSVKYASFRFKGIDKSDTVQLITYARHVVKTARGMIDELTVRRVDEDLLAIVIKAITKLDDAIDTQKQGKVSREEKAYERLERANELYAMVAEASEVGKRAWDGKNQAFYDDYVIYGSQSSISEDEEPVDENTDLEEAAEA